jgi:hypothetical protein
VEIKIRDISVVRRLLDNFSALKRDVFACYSLQETAGCLRPTHVARRSLFINETKDLAQKKLVGLWLWIKSLLFKL